MRDWRAAAESGIQKEQSPLVSTGFSPGVEEVWADADQEGGTWPARPTSQARTGTREIEEATYYKNNTQEEVKR